MGIRDGCDRLGGAAELEQRIIYTLRDGAVVRAEVYGDPEKALEAAGVSE